MARIRTVKPEFWSDEKLAPLPPLVRLVFLGLISMADDAGRVVDNVKSIDGFIFPESEETSRDALDTLASHSRILRYTSASGQKLIQIANWLKHQKVDKPAKYVLPAPSKPSRESRDSLANVSRSDLGPTTNDLLPPTVEAEQQGGGVVGESLASESTDLYGQSVDELKRRMGECPGADESLETFLAGLPNAAKRLVWARSLVTSLEPISGGRKVPPPALAAALADFNLASRDRFPYTGACFRAFVDRAEADLTRAPRSPPGTPPTDDELSRWVRDTKAREAAASGAHE